MPSVVGIVAVDKKNVMYLGITNLVITEALLSSLIFKTIMVPLHTGRFVIVHLYSGFSIDLQDFLYGKFIPSSSSIYLPQIKTFIIITEYI